MNDFIQYTLAGFIVAIATFVATRTVYRTFKNKKTALNNCDDCKLAGHCHNKKQHNSPNNTNSACDNKVEGKLEQ